MPNLRMCENIRVPPLGYQYTGKSKKQKGIHVVRLNPYLRQNYSIFMRNLKQNQHKLPNNDIQFSNRDFLCKFELPCKKSWTRPCFYHLFYFIYMGQPIWDPYGTHMEPGCTAHMGPIWVPTWDPYGSHIDC